MISPSPILKVTLRWLVVLLFLVSIFLLLRGHDLPGGGFAGGLLAAAAVIVTSIAENPAAGRRLLRVEPVTLIAWGLLLALFTGLPPLLFGHSFLTALWVKIPLGFAELKLGTPLFFDIGVYVVVLGVVSTFALEIDEAQDEGGASSKS